MSAKAKLGSDPLGEEGRTSIVTQQRAPGPVGSLRETEKGDRWVRWVLFFFPAM